MPSTKAELLAIGMDDAMAEHHLRTEAVTAEVMAANPAMHPITAHIIAGDRVSAEAWTARVNAGEYTAEKAVWLIGSYSRMAWALDNCDPAFVTKHLAELWRGSDPDDTDPRFLELWQLINPEQGVYTRDGKALPRNRVLTIWRGQMPSEPVGIAWTLDPAIAHKFAKGAGVRMPMAGGVLEGQVNRYDVMGYLTGRGESEVIVDPNDVKHRHVIGVYETRKAE